MTVAVGSQVGSYHITAFLGEGGMGRVFRAHDGKLKRDVAIKILPEHFSGDADRIARFQREAEALASLNHSNIAGIHDIMEIDGSRLLVLELVEGETLAQHIAHGALPVDEAIEITKQIAEALEAAHERGVVHRDLKPANVKIAPDGKVKVLDFGLAKIREAVSAASELSNSPTLVSGTVPGMIIGTAAYMSPEQARSKSVDRSADVWALACVLYEMLTGRKAFDGETITDIFSAIVKTDPEWDTLPKNVPPNVKRLLRRCLAKDRRHRLRDAGAVLLELNEPSETAVVVQRTKSSRWPWIAVALSAVALVAASILLLRPAPRPPELRVEVATPGAAAADAAEFAISPDGQKLVFSATADGRTRLWLRSLDSTTAKPLSGTEDGGNVFWSPDGRSIGFFAGGKLKRLDIAGGAFQTLANAPGNRGGTWGPNGIILFAPLASGAIFRISDRGGETVAVTKTESGRQSGHRHPYFLPDGEHFLFYAQGTPEARGVYVASLDGSVTRRLADADAAAVYFSGYLLFAREATIFAQNFNIKDLSVKGEPFPVAEQVALDGSNKAALSALLIGSWMYRASGASDQRQFVWFDRSGKEIARIGSADSANANGAELSPDGRRVAVTRAVNANNDIWLLEIQRGIWSRLTSNPAGENYPVWSPDGRRIALNSSRNGVLDLYEKPVNGTGNEQLLVATSLAKTANDWSPDGGFLLYRQADPKTDYDIWALPLNGERKPSPVVQTNFAELDAQFSPDGKWIAYQSNESGRFEIYAQPFPGLAPKIQISTNGGAQVRWPRAGKKLFYVALDGQLMAVPLRIDSKSNSIDPGNPASLFRPRMVAGAVNLVRQQYMVSPDGQRFLINTAVGETSISPITLVLNWNPAAK